MPRKPPIEQLTERLVNAINEIQKHHPHISTDRDLIRFMNQNGVVIHITAISKWKNGNGFPTLQQVQFICTWFKEYASADYIIYGQ